MAKEDAISLSDVSQSQISRMSDKAHESKLPDSTIVDKETADGQSSTKEEEALAYI